MEYYLDYCLPPLAILVFCLILSLLGGRIPGALNTPSKRANQTTCAPAAQSLLNGLDGFNAAAHVLTAQIIALPLLLYGAYMTYLYFFPENGHWSGVAILGAGMVGFEINRYFRLRNIRAGYRTARLVYQDKMVTSQALIPLMHTGYVIFHEVQYDGRTIDHVLIGPKGVFAIQTHTHPRLPAAEAAKNVVRYDGRTLMFGEENEHAAIEGIEKIVEQLSEWLSEPLPEGIAVRPILALPGWTIKRTSVDGMPVVNPKQFGSLFQHISPRPLDPATVSIISERILGIYGQDTRTAGEPADNHAAAVPAGH